MKISIFIPSYNQKRYLIEAIESALNQTLKPFQIIIVDDSSTDRSQDVIRDYYSRYQSLITPIYHTKNTGIAQVRVDALKAVRGDYVTYMDGDDHFLPTKIEKEATLLNENPDAQIAFSNNYYMTEDRVYTEKWIEGGRPPVGYVFCQTFARDYPKRRIFRMELVNYRAWQEVGFHDPRLHIYEDYDMRIRLTKRLRTIYYDEPLSEVRCHNKGLSNSTAAAYVKAIDYIYKKNSYLLADLSKGERTYVERKLYEWSTKIAKRAAKEALKQNQPIQAAKYYLKTLPIFR